MESFTVVGRGCGYRYCHAPDVPRGQGSHTDCQLAQVKLQSNALAAQTNMCRKVMQGAPPTLRLV